MQVLSRAFENVLVSTMYLYTRDAEHVRRIKETWILFKWPYSKVEKEKPLYAKIFKTKTSACAYEFTIVIVLCMLFAVYFKL